jgi:hypothetical protein
MSAGSFDHENLISNGLKICAEVHTAFDGNDALFGGFDPDMGEDRLIQTLAPNGADHDADIGRCIQHPQDRHRAQTGVHAGKHDTGKREFTIAESLHAETALKWVLPLLSGLSAQQSRKLPVDAQFMSLGCDFRVIQ